MERVEYIVEAVAYARVSCMVQAIQRTRRRQILALKVSSARLETGGSEPSAISKRLASIIRLIVSAETVGAVT